MRSYCTTYREVAIAFIQRVVLLGLGESGVMEREKVKENIDIIVDLDSYSEL